MDYSVESIKREIMSDLYCNEEQANVVYRKAFELGHSEGMDGVYYYATELVEMIQGFIRVKE